MLGSCKSNKNENRSMQIKLRKLSTVVCSPWRSQPKISGGGGGAKRHRLVQWRPLDSAREGSTGGLGAESSAATDF